MARQKECADCTFPWAMLVGAGVALETWALRTGHDRATLSHALRCWLRTKHPVGKTLTYAGWALLTAWLIPHLLAEGKVIVAEIIESD